MESSGKDSYPTIKDFVIQEAHQKAFEKLVMGLKEYEREKTRIFGDRKVFLHEEFDKKHKDNQAQRRIAKSSRINESRMKKMNVRHENLQAVVTSAEHTLADQICTNKDRYRPLLKSLILEGLIKMLEPIVYIRCINRDAELIGGLIKECKEEFRAVLEREGIDESLAEVDLRLDDRYTLKEKNRGEGQRIHKSEESEICFGGVIMTNEDGLIVCKNTLDARLQLAYQQLLPSIRSSLYSE